MQCTSAHHKGRNTPDGKVLRQLEEQGLMREFDYQANLTRITYNLGRQEDYFFTGTGSTLRWNGHRRFDGSEIHFSYNG